MTELTDLAQERRQRLLAVTRDTVGKGRAGLGDDPSLRKDVVTLGIGEVDKILGGGLRMGRMCMVVGHESMGKTLFTQWVMRAFQERGLICGFIDPEKTFDAGWFAKTGVVPEQLVVVHPESTEQTFDLACLWAQEGMDLIVIDSLAALTPKARASADLADQEFMGLAARKTSEGLNRFTNVNVNALMICTNQMRSKLGVVYGSPDDIPGGRAQKFYASYILQISRKGWIRNGDQYVGYHLGIRTLKNKLAPPRQEAQVPFMYAGNIDYVWAAVDAGIDLRVLPGRRGYYEWRGVKYHGRDRLMDHFRDSADDLQELNRLIQLGGGNGTVDDGSAPDIDEDSL